MSKMDGLRAMREARYAEAAARARQGTTPARATAPRLAPVTSAPAGRASAPSDAEPAVEGLCGQDPRVRRATDGHDPGVEPEDHK